MKDTNPWFNGTYDNIDFRKELTELGIVEDTTMTTWKEQTDKMIEDDYNRLCGSNEQISKLHTVFSKWCVDNGYTGNLARMCDINIDDIPKREQLAGEPSISRVWASSILMFFCKSKEEGYYIYSLTDKQSREILANDFPDLYGLLIKDGNLAELPFSDNY